MSERKPIISLCDYTGNAVKPWLDAGHECWIFDTQHPRGITREGLLVKVGADVYELHPYHQWMPATAYMVFAWPPCTHLAYSGARWRRKNGPRAAAMGFLTFAACWDLCRYYEHERGARWMIENPDGWVCSWCQPDYSFDPYEYGDGYTKHTNLWVGGGFVMPAKVPSLFAERVDDRIHRCPPGSERQNIRSATPMGFANAVYEANRYGEYAS